MTELILGSETLQDCANPAEYRQPFVLRDSEPLTSPSIEPWLVSQAMRHAVEAGRPSRNMGTALTFVFLQDAGDPTTLFRWAGFANFKG